MSLLTSHSVLNTQFSIMHSHNDPLCPACVEGEKTLIHFIVKWCATMMTCHRIMGVHTLQLEELSKVSPSNLLKFTEALLRFK